MLISVGYPLTGLIVLEISNTGDSKSFGYYTSRERWPSILQNVINDVKETVEDCSGERSEEGKGVISALEGLKREVEIDAVLMYCPVRPC
jgi:hypothetical protein